LAKNVLNLMDFWKRTSNKRMTRRHGDTEMERSKIRWGDGKIGGRARLDEPAGFWRLRLYPKPGFERWAVAP